MNGRIAVVGDRESILAFKSVGMETYESHDPATTEKIITDLAGEEVSVIFVTEDAIQPVMHLLDKYKDCAVPAIIPIPGKNGSKGIGMANVKSSVERAVGADILFNDQ